MRAHPRVGGENLGLCPFLSQSRGSSPRGRGKPPRKCRARRRTRLIPAWAGKTLGGGAARPEDDWLIPAWAGKTSMRLTVRSARAAHPRVGGENAKNVAIPALQDGSSPRGRGKRVVSTYYQLRFRLIPAWAGKTSLRGTRAAGRAAHPRVGGENVTALR